jgi:hypothetical protein
MKPIYPGYAEAKDTDRKEEFDKKGISKFAKCPDCGEQLNRIYVKKGLLNYEALPLGQCLKCQTTFSVWWGRLPREIKLR